jgi:hypothetical protein
MNRLLGKKCEVSSRQIMMPPEAGVSSTPSAGISTPLSLDLNPVLNDLNTVQNTLSSVNDNTSYEHVSRQLDFDGMSLTQRGGLYTLKGLVGMNAIRYIGIPDDLMSNGLQILKITLFFMSNGPKDITINALPAHPYNGSYIENLYTAAASTAISVILAFGENYQYTRLQKIQISTLNGTAIENVFFVVTLKSIIPKDNF